MASIQLHLCLRKEPIKTVLEILPRCETGNGKPQLLGSPWFPWGTGGGGGGHLNEQRISSVIKKRLRHATWHPNPSQVTSPGGPLRKQPPFSTAEIQVCVRLVEKQYVSLQWNSILGGASKDRSS